MTSATSEKEDDKQTSPMISCSEQQPQQETGYSFVSIHSFYSVVSAGLCIYHAGKENKDISRSGVPTFRCSLHPKCATGIHSVYQSEIFA